MARNTNKKATPASKHDRSGSAGQSTSYNTYAHHTRQGNSTGDTNGSPSTFASSGRHSPVAATFQATSLRSRFGRNASVDDRDLPSQSQPQQPSPRGLLDGWRRRRANSDTSSTHSSEAKHATHGRGLSSGSIVQPLPISARWATSGEATNSSGNSSNPSSPAPSSPATPSTLAVPRYDARGYPIKDAFPDVKASHSPGSRSMPSPRPSKGQKPRERPLSTGSNSSQESFRRLPDERERYPQNGSGSARSSTYGGIEGDYNTARRASLDTGEGSIASFYQRPMEYNHSSTSGPGSYTNAYFDRQRGDPSTGHSLYGESIRSFETERSSAFFAEHGAGAGYTDFSINSKNGRRVVVSMLEDPTEWMTMGPEEDDDLHNPRIKSRQRGIWSSLCTVRGASNVGCIALLVVILVVLFAGYPIMTAYMTPKMGNLGGYNLGGLNASGQLPDVGLFSIIDKDTPADALHHTSWETGEQWDLVFSDEFNRDGRTFYAGEDPFWEAGDLHYWGTNNKEWYDPKALTTRDGHLVVTLTNETSHNLNYTGGLMTTWNRFCFTGGYIESSVSLPGYSNIYGLWPAVWTLGNLGRAGYGGTLDGMWPYTYDSCDVGTLPNQTLNGLPRIAMTSGSEEVTNYELSYLPGQRLSRCTCPDDPTHPGPKHPDGTWVGRAAPEIDVIEAQVDQHTLIGHVSQSAQWAPYNPYYQWINTTETFKIYNHSVTELNTYQGGVYQQATSGVAITDQNCYTGNASCFSIYGFEYEPGPDGYITWINDAVPSWTVRGAAMGPNAAAQIGQRPVPHEPMYIIINLGLSENFGAIDYEGLQALWPVEMHVNYVRVYQDPKKKNIGCDPADYPTAKYIDNLGPAYWNPNISTYQQAVEAIPEHNLAWPKNNLLVEC